MRFKAKPVFAESLIHAPTFPAISGLYKTIST